MTQNWLDASDNSDGYACFLSLTGAEHAACRDCVTCISVFTHGAQRSIWDIYWRWLNICKRIEWVPSNRYLKPGKDSEVILKNGLRREMGSPRRTKMWEGWEHVLSEDKMKGDGWHCGGSESKRRESWETEAVSWWGSWGRASEALCPRYLWASDLVVDLVVAPKGSSSSSSSSSSSDSWSFLSSVASETDFWRFLSGSEDSVQTAG